MDTKMNERISRERWHDRWKTIVLKLIKRIYLFENEEKPDVVRTRNERSLKNV